MKRTLKYIIILPFTTACVLVAAAAIIPYVSIMATWNTSGMSYADVKEKARLYLKVKKQAQ